MKIVGGETELEGGGIYPRKGVCRPWRLRRVHLREQSSRERRREEENETESFHGFINAWGY